MHVPTPSGDTTSSRLLMRFGVPAIVLLFYVTASRHFAYTPDTTFTTLNTLQVEPPGSLWMMLLSLAGLFRVDMLLAAKVLGLVFCTLSVMLAYLIANEIMTDHIAAFCVALAYAMQASLLQLSVSGSGLGFVLVLSLATVFSLLQNEYVLATVLAALSTLVAWQAGALLFVLLLDVYINSVERTRAGKLAISMVLVFAGILLPWVLYSMYVGALLFPDELAASDVPTLSPQMLFETVLLVGLVFVGVVILAARDRETLRLHTAVLLWAVAASLLHRMMFALTLPLILAFAFFSFRRIVQLVGGMHLAHWVAPALVSVILLYCQFVSHPAMTMLMERAVQTNAELRSAASWLETNMPDGTMVSVPEEHTGIVQFYSGKTIGDGVSRFMISDEQKAPGYEVVFDPVKFNPDLLTGSPVFRVWRRL